MHNPPNIKLSLQLSTVPPYETIVVRADTTFCPTDAVCAANPPVVKAVSPAIPPVTPVGRDFLDEIIERKGVIGGGDVAWETASIATEGSELVFYRGDRWTRRCRNKIPPEQSSHSAEAVCPPQGPELPLPFDESASAVASPETPEVASPEVAWPPASSAEAPVCEFVPPALVASHSVSLRVAGIGLANSALSQMPRPWYQYAMPAINETVARSKSRPNRRAEAARPTTLPTHSEKVEEEVVVPEEEVEVVVQGGDLLWI